ncbi:hypothetical protein HII31_01383 [Pseudocercospora fuligena]|uniref:Uncharacterized protein n=1 Tax=Pseudocercospora fuligena TaxID=685502 RepID=A0A8H6RUS3_9PEZI|nr:hypothetical protein HII31_01383 [Pseudocercospora fuligena]
MRFTSKIKKVAATITCHCHIPEPSSPPKNRNKKPVTNNLTKQPFKLQAPETGTIAMRRHLARIDVDAKPEKAPLIQILPADDEKTRPTKASANVLRRRSLSPAVAKRIMSMAITIDVKTLSKFFDESELDARRYSTRSAALEM